MFHVAARMPVAGKRAIPALIAFCAVALAPLLAEINWVHLSSSTGDLPVPGTSTQQTGVTVGRFDRDSPATDFVLSFRVVGPALVWYRHTPKGWDRYVIEKDFLTLEAGGAVYDIDGDGDLDIVFGGDWQSDTLWWWENPYPPFDPNVPWKRHVIKKGGATQHHDQVFGDFKGTGKPQLAFWNQGAKTIFLADIPADPRHTEPWPMEVIFSGKAGEGNEGAAAYAEGMDAFDVDGDGRVDLLAGNYWFKYENGKFRPIKVGKIGGRIKAAKFKPGKYAQIVIAPGDGSGPVTLYECKGDPTNPADWVGRDLIGRDLNHGHTLDIGDVDGDGNLDILTAEQGQWHENSKVSDDPHAQSFILYGDGKGNFRKTVFTTGMGWHDGKILDLDGDGRMDLLNKPYTWNAPRVDVWLNRAKAGAKRK
jgi:hypothetical protein